MVADDLIAFSDGWQLSRLLRIGGNWEVVLEKDIGVKMHPHFETIFKRGRGRTQREALRNACQSASFRVTVGEPVLSLSA